MNEFSLERLVANSVASRMLGRAYSLSFDAETIERLCIVGSRSDYAERAVGGPQSLDMPAIEDDREARGTVDERDER